MTINLAQDHMHKAQAALSKLNTLLVMMKLTANYLGEHRDQLEMIEWINVTDLLIDQMEDISPNIENVECFLNGLFCESKGIPSCQS